MHRSQNTAATRARARVDARNVSAEIHYAAGSRMRDYDGERSEQSAAKEMIAMFFDGLTFERCVRSFPFYRALLLPLSRKFRETNRRPLGSPFASSHARTENSLRE